MRGGIYGPYEQRRRGSISWLVRVRASDGYSSTHRFPSEASAKAFIRLKRTEAEGATTVEATVTEYLGHLRDKGTKPESIRTTGWRLGAWLDDGLTLGDLSPQWAAATYKARSKIVAPATHRAELAEVRTFCRWATERGYLRRDPTERVKPVGKVRKRKAQLTHGEAITLSDYLFSVARKPSRKSNNDAPRRNERATAIACLLALWAGLRSGEIRALTVRCVDIVDGRLRLWVEQGKTDNAARWLEVQDPLAGLLIALASGRSRNDLLFGPRAKTWLRAAVHRSCERAGVPMVGPHGLRGTFASLASESGIETRAVAAMLGHGADTRVTTEHYVEAGSEQRQAARRTMRLMKGGK